MAAPPDLPEELIPWKDIVMLAYDSSNEKLKKLRLAGYEKAVREQRAFPRQRVMSQEVLDMIIDYIRPSTPWALRPSHAVVPAAPKLVCPEEAEASPLAPFKWRWLDIPVPWHDRDGQQAAHFRGG